LEVESELNKIGCFTPPADLMMCF